MFFYGFDIELKLKKPSCFSNKTVFFQKKKSYLIIAEQATLAPAFPAGCETKSSAP